MFLNLFQVIISSVAPESRIQNSPYMVGSLRMIFPQTLYRPFFPKHHLSVVSLFLGIAFFVVFTGPSADVSAAEPAWNNESNVRVLLVPKVETVLSGEIHARIQHIDVDIGDSFERGQDLVLFDCEMYRAELSKARAELAEADKTHEINKRLEVYKSVSELDLAVSVTRMDRAKAEVALREAQVGKCILTAPFSGRVLKRQAQPFEYVAPGQPLLEIIDDVHLSLQLFVPSKWLRWIKPKNRFSVRIDETGKQYSAAITVLGARVDPVSQSLEVRAEIEGQHPELLAGMSGTARFKVGGK